MALIRYFFIGILIFPLLELLHPVFFFFIFELAGYHGFAFHRVLVIDLFIGQ